MSWGSWISVAWAAVSAAIDAGKAKRAELKGAAPDLGWRERQAEADRRREAASRSTP